MKKLCAFILSVLMFFGVNLPILAQTLSNPITKEVTPDKNIIVCDGNSFNNDLCSKLIFSQKNIELKSELKENFRAILYKIQNNSEDNVEIVNIDNMKEAKPIADDRIRSRNRSHGSNTGSFLLMTMIGFVPPFILVSPILVPVGLCGILYETTLGKLNLVVGNYAISKEAEHFKKYSFPITLEKGKSIELLLFVDGKKIELNGININLVNLQTKQNFVIKRGFKYSMIN